MRIRIPSDTATASANGTVEGVRLRAQPVSVARGDVTRGGAMNVRRRMNSLPKICYEALGCSD
jgi:hypothetical protein